MSTEQLSNWWVQTAEQDLTVTGPKAAEYADDDLEVMGNVMSNWGLTAQRIPPASAAEEGAGMEAACMWYILGKVARAVAAYKRGRLPSADTLKDITVYSMMARRIRETGRWP